MSSDAPVDQIAALERGNYAALQDWVGATPGSTLSIRPDVIVTRAHLFPGPDMNHACSFQSTETEVEPLIDELVRTFRRLGRKTHVFLSPACMPADLGKRLLRRGFKKQDQEEAWLALDLPTWQPPDVGWDAVEVVRAGREDADAFVRVFLTAFGMMPALTPAVAMLFRRLMRVPTTHYYLARVDGQAVGGCVRHSHDGITAAGAMGVIPAFRGSRVATTLMKQLAVEAQAEGDRVVLMQTLNVKLGDWACQHGFKRVFTRTHYVLPG